MSTSRIPNARRRLAASALGGFTLVELLVTIGIILVVLSVSVIAFGPALRGAGSMTGARILRVALDTARVRAIQHRRNIRFEAQRTDLFDPGNAAMEDGKPEQWVITANAGDPGQLSSPTQWHRLPEQIAVRIKAGSAVLGTQYKMISISFAPDGSVSRLLVLQPKAGQLTALDWVSPIVDVKSPNISNPIRIRLDTTRTIKDVANPAKALLEKQQTSRFIDITPLTGVMQSFGFDEALSKCPGDLPQS